MIAQRPARKVFAPGSYRWDPEKGLLSSDAELFGKAKAQAPPPTLPPIAFGPLRVECFGRQLYVCGEGHYFEVESRSKAAQEIRELQAPPVLDCYGLMRLGCGGARHDPELQNPHAEDSCPCVKPGRALFQEFGTIAYPASEDDPRPCHSIEETVIEGVRVRLCCRCAGLISTPDLIEAARAFAGTQSNAPALAAPPGGVTGFEAEHRAPSVEPLEGPHGPSTDSLLTRPGIAGAAFLSAVREER
jgi:hypothetical protein